MLTIKDKNGKTICIIEDDGVVKVIAKEVVLVDALPLLEVKEEKE